MISMVNTLKEIISQTDLILSHFVFKNACFCRQNDEVLVSLTSYFFLRITLHVFLPKFCVCLNETPFFYSWDFPKYQRLIDAYAFNK